MTDYRTPITCPIELDKNDVGGTIGKVGNDGANKVTVEFDSPEYREWRREHFGKVGNGVKGHQQKLL